MHRKLLKWGEVRVSDVDGHSLGNTNQYKDEDSVESFLLAFQGNRTILSKRLSRRVTHDFLTSNPLTTLTIY